MRIGTEANIAGCRDMPGWNPLQLVCLWPVLVGSVAAAVVIALVSGN
jgi:hypothetical protein